MAIGNIVINDFIWKAFINGFLAKTLIFTFVNL